MDGANTGIDVKAEAERAFTYTKAFTMEEAEKLDDAANEVIYTLSAAAANTEEQLHQIASILRLCGRGLTNVADKEGVTLELLARNVARNVKERADAE